MLLSSIYFCFISCKTEKQENPYNVAKDYCNCLEHQLKITKDSNINIYDCEKTVFPKSRLMRIYMSSYDEQNGTSSTIDSARKFSLQVRNIIDTMCLNKLDREKIK